MKKIKIVTTLIVTLAVLAGFAAAADISFNASVDMNEVPLNQTLTLSVEISGAGRRPPDPSLPEIQGFDVRGTSTSSSISIINMDMTTTKTVSYTLSPQKKGEFVIPAATIEYEGRTYKTEQIKVKVVDPVKVTRNQARSVPPGFENFFSDNFSSFGRQTVTENDIFVKMESDKKEVYVNEEIVLTFSLFNAPQIRFYQNPSYAPPSYTGFWTEEIPPVGRGEYKVINGERYVVSEIKTALFPVTAGEITIQEASVAVQFDIFSNPAKLSTDPVTLKVLPLPPVPAGIQETSLVGAFKIDAAIDKSEVIEGDPIEIVVRIMGVGNIHSITKPLFTPINSFEIFDPQEKENINRKNGRIEGEKNFKYILIPRKAGEYTIGPFESAYFDPVQKKYIKLTTKTFDIKVTPGKNGSLVTERNSIIKNEVARTGEDINYIKDDMDSLEDYSGPYYESRVMQALLLLPVVWFLALFVYRKRAEHLQSDPGYIRRAGAYKRAKREIAKFDLSLKNGEYIEFISSVDSAIRGYISDKFNLPSASVNSEKIKELSNEKNSETLKQAGEILEKCDIARFSQSTINTNSMTEIMAQTKKIIEDLEKVL